MTDTSKKFISVTLKLMVSAGLMYLILQNISITPVISSLNVYTVGVVISVVLLQFLSIVLASFKWGLLLTSQSFLKLLKFTLIGQFYSLILPGQVTGELAKALRFGQDSVIGKEEIASSILMDKIIGLLGLTLLTCIGLLYASVDGRQALILSNGGLLIFLVVLVFLVSYKRTNEMLVRFFVTWEGVNAWITPCAQFFQKVFASYRLCIARRRLVVLENLALSVAIHLILVLIILLFSHSLGMAISYLDWLWIYGLVSLATFLPISIAGIGVREGVFLFFATLLGGGAETAIALSLSVLALQLLVSLFGGMLELGSVYKNIRTKNVTPSL